MTCDRFALWDGAYVLGSLSTSDRRDYETHLRGCTSCSAAVAALAALPGLLATVPRETALAEPLTPAAPTPVSLAGGEDRLFAALRRQRHRQRVRDGLIAAALALAVAVPATLLTQHNHQGSSATVAFRPMTDVVPNNIDAGVGLTHQSWGTTVSVRCTYRADSSVSNEKYGAHMQRYALTITDLAGRTTQLATWIGVQGATVTPSASTDVPVASLRSIDIRATNTNTVLLTAPA